VDTGIWLMSVRADQTHTTTQVSTTTQNVNLFPGRLIPDGQDGLIASWIESPIVPAGQPPDQSTFRARRVLAGGGGISFDLPLTPPLDLLHPADSPLPTNPELALGQNDRAFVSYGNTVGGFLVSNGAGGWSYAATNDITMVSAASDASLVAKTLAVDGTDTILRFPAGGGVTTSTFGLAEIGHVVKDLWTTTSAASGTGLLKGESIGWTTNGWFQPSSGGQRRVRRVFRDRGTVPGHQDAAIEALATFRALVSKWEIGAAICKKGLNYWWTDDVTSEDAGSVDVIGLAGPKCTTEGAAMVADVHFHLPNGGGSPYPSGPDFGVANNHPSLTFYLSVQRPNSNPPSFWYLKYKGPNASNMFTCQWNGARFMTFNGIVWTPCGIP
jgi:hypothetical protein